MKSEGVPCLEDPDVLPEGALHRTVRFGSIAWSLGKKALPTKTHKWVVFVRGPQNEPLRFVSKVEFHLHESFAQSVRTVAAAPFEVHETGWGEFEVKMVVHFVDPQEEPVVLIHMLRLHPDMGRPATMAPVVAEQGDDIVFLSPSAVMTAALQTDPGYQEGVTRPHPLLDNDDLVTKTLRNGPEVDQELQLLEEAKKALKMRALRAKRDFDALQSESVALTEQLEAIVAKKSRVYASDPVVLWRPEDVRHVPMMAEHDTGKKKKQKKEAVAGVAAVATASSGTNTSASKAGGPGRKKKKTPVVPKKKIKI